MSDATADGQVNEVVGHLEEDIIFARLRPRERLVEDALMARFRAKRHVVRAALVELARMGIVTRERNKGAYVRDFSVSEVEELYWMRETLQREAAWLIPLPAEDTLVDRLETIHKAHAAATHSNDLGAVYRLNNAFHDALFGACGNRYLAESIAHFAWITHAIRSYRIADPALLAQARDEHGRMVEALRTGDRDTLVALCVDHIKPSKQAYLAAHGGAGVEGQELKTA